MAVHNVAIAVMELMSSTSSSDDEVVITALTKRKKIHKIKNFLEIVNKFSEEEFRQHFRLKQSTANAIIERYQTSPFYPSDKTHGGVQRMSAEHDFLTFLWFSGNKVCLRDVTQRFGVATSTTFCQIDRVMNFFLSIASNVITFPQDKEQAATEFFNIARFPNTLGCIDGTSIKIRTPAGKIKSIYVNQHDTSSITLQGICDSKKRFIDTSVGTPGKIHDARVYQLADISVHLPQICNKQYHIIGDSAYPIREWLLVPFRDYGTLNRQQKFYNKRFCATRVLIENTFGLLKGRFRQLLELDMHRIHKICKFVTSCCVVHNLCIEYNDENIFDIVVKNDEDIECIEDIVSDQLLKRLGEEKRLMVMRMVDDDNEQRYN